MLILGQREPCLAIWHDNQHLSEVYSIVSMHFWLHFIFINCAKLKFCRTWQNIIIVYHDFLPPPRRGSHVKGKVFYGQEPPSGKSTTTECGVNYRLLAVITEASQWGTPSCSQPQPAMDNGVRDCRFNWLVAPSTLMGSTSWAPRA